MHISIPFVEVLALAASQGPLPPMVAGLRSEGSTAHADIDLREVPSTSTAMRFALAAAGTVTVTARVVSFAAGVATVAVTAHAWGLPAHKLLPYLVDPIAGAVRKAGLPDGIVRIERGDGDPVVLVDVQKAVDSRVEGLVVTGVALTDDQVVVDAAVGAFRRL
ncbi:hypothetical protein [Marisediminicola senii]|uniref:hypothetical protein n=1 Tax=Marisediminicola senii TaxID=2711233 RepID=UPI0013EB40AD|nr:hypothetical protein [Marisediminicola senii]